jgi:hypothetical protein
MHHEEERAEKRQKRREKKKRPAMKVSGRGTRDLAKRLTQKA